MRLPWKWRTGKELGVVNKGEEMWEHDDINNIDMHIFSALLPAACQSVSVCVQVVVCVCA